MSGYADLAGKPVASAAGSTNENVLRKYSEEHGLYIQLIAAKDYGDGLEMLEDAHQQFRGGPLPQKQAVEGVSFLPIWLGRDGLSPTLFISGGWVINFLTKIFRPTLDNHRLMTKSSSRRQQANGRAEIFMAVLTLFVAACANTNPAANHVTLETIRVQLSAGAADVDVYWPNNTTKAPLVIVAHGFSRHRKNMSGWGLHLANEGFVAVVPDLPAWADHAQNGLFISELRAYLLGDESLKKRIDPTKVGLLGFSAGGLSSLLSAANSPDLAVWIGLDPVDRNSLGVKAAAMLKARAVVLTADPSACNAYGNALDIVSALPRPEHFSVNGAVHVDAEWPTSWLAELVCGRSTAKNRSEFQERTTKALKETFALPADHKTKHTVITEH